MLILIADPRPEVQSALHLILNQCSPASKVEETGSLVQLLARCAQTCPGLILVDRDLARSSRSDPQALAGLVSVLRRMCPSSRVVVMGSPIEAEQEARLAGADGFLGKADLPEVVRERLAKFLENLS